MRTIVVTGASRGLGRALVERFLEHGHRVLACARAAGSLDGTPPRARERLHFAPVDVADDGAVQSWARDTLERWGAPHLVVNNAAVIHAPAPLWEVSAAELGALLAVNVAGTANVIRAFVPAMMRAGRGVVVNLSSTWGRTDAPHFAPYCASKWAIEGLTRSLAGELPPGLAAVSLNPGVIDTDMLRRVQGDGAASCEGPEAWSRRAAPFLLGLGPRDNGAVASIP